MFYQLHRNSIDLNFMHEHFIIVFATLMDEQFNDDSFVK